MEDLLAAEPSVPGGVGLPVTTFHSRETRIVKRFSDPEKGGPPKSRHLPQAATEAKRWSEIRKPIKPGAEELDRNPRARSAILRSARRSGAPARALSYEGLAVPKVRGL